MATGAMYDLTGGFAAPLYMLTAICAVLAVLAIRLWSTTASATAPAPQTADD